MRERDEEADQDYILFGPYCSKTDKGQGAPTVSERAPRRDKRFGLAGHSNRWWGQSTNDQSMSRHRKLDNKADTGLRATESSSLAIEAGYMERDMRFRYDPADARDVSKQNKSRKTLPRRENGLESATPSKRT